MLKRKSILFSAIFFLVSLHGFSQQNQISVIAYYAGGPDEVDSFSVEKLTHIIFSFSHLKGNQLYISGSRDKETIRKLVNLKRRNPELKVILSLGGWGGCATCSDVFSSAKDREAFAQSVKRLSQYYHTDGIDLDWEYPAISGFPSHKYQPEDKENFTSLIKQLRETLGKKYEISFAAGGFKKYIDSSVEWNKVMPEVDRVNVMTYDLIGGYDTVTGHHTALYSTSQQERSVDQAITQLINAGVPKNKIVIGAAFYARVWENVADSNYGLYQRGKFKKGINYRNFNKEFSEQNGYTSYWDEVAKAPYSYNASQQLFATYDDKKSIELKTQYVIDKGLNGIMFWELSLDTFHNGLLGVIDDVKKNYKTN